MSYIPKEQSKKGIMSKRNIFNNCNSHFVMMEKQQLFDDLKTGCLLPQNTEHMGQGGTLMTPVY